MHATRESANAQNRERLAGTMASAPIFATLARVKVQLALEEKLTIALSPQKLIVENESRMHSVPPGSETHFKVLVVSTAFEGLGRVARQRRVNEALRDELASGVHALTMRTLTPAEWERDGVSDFESPKCLGGSKAEGH